MDKCICLIVNKPSIIWLDFLQKFKNYDIYLLIDDNTEDYNIMYKYPTINFIQINNEECEKHGFINANFTLKKNVSGWEKALLYFSNINTKYNNIWFIEDDVFFNNEKTLINIDLLYNDADLISNRMKANIDGKKDYWLWNNININFNPPYYNGMVCACRMSQKILQHINNYAKENNTLFFIEALIPTLANKYKLKYVTPPQLRMIIYRRDWKLSEINKNTLYHPIKDMDIQKIYRNKLK